MLVCVVVTVVLLNNDERSETEVAVDIVDIRLDGDIPLRSRWTGGGGTRRMLGCGLPVGVEREGGGGGAGFDVVRGLFAWARLRWGSLGGSGLCDCEVKSFSHSCVEDWEGLATPVEDTVSKENESSTLSRSRSDSRSCSALSMGYVATKFDTEELPSVPPSDDSDTEWKEDVDEACT
jgi:hypothetical protein